MRKAIGLACVMLLLMTSCKLVQTNLLGQGKSDKAHAAALTHVLKSKVLTAEDQARLTPTSVLDILKKGNEEFVKDNLTIRNNAERISDAVQGQYPMAAVLSCIDSPVPVEDIFHSAIGDLFVTSVAGNVVGEDILGSLEYACKISGAKLIMVLGHEKCGVVMSAVKNVKVGNASIVLSKITPSVAKVAETFGEAALYTNTEFVEAVCAENVRESMIQVRMNSPILKEMETNGEIMLVGAMYNMETGKVDFYEN